MDYIEINFRLQPNAEYITDILSALLGEIGYESFVPNEQGMVAYVAHSLFDENKLKKILDDFPVDANIEYISQYIKGRNWNEEWEKNYFQPIVIAERCVVHSTFHTDVPAAEFDIVIDPKMSFGTGHHETTSLMINEVLDMDIKNKTVLDMGSGTAVLAILAFKRGAGQISAIDIDEFAFENAKENILLNNAASIDVRLGGAELLEPSVKYDIILANINRNILLNDIHTYVQSMEKGSELYLSGFYQEDIPTIRGEAEKYGLKFVHSHSKNRWVTVKFSL